MNRTTIRYGLLMFFSFTAFFLLMYVLGFGHNLNLRVINGVIHLTILWFAMHDWARSHPNSLHEYPAGVGHGIVVSMVGIVPFTIFLSIFMGMHPELMATLQQKVPLGEHLTPITMSVFVLMESLAAALIGSYIYVRILERRQMHAD